MRSSGQWRRFLARHRAISTASGLVVAVGIVAFVRLPEASGFRGAGAAAAQPLLPLAVLAHRPAAPPGKVVALSGIRMYYEEHGTGAALVLLHGGAGNGMQFEKQLPDFIPHYRCIVPDLTGQGRTTDRPGPLTYHAMADDVVALLDKLHVETADLMGWSDGGVVGIDIAIHHPERLRHLVTFGANFAPDGLNAPDVHWNQTATADSFGPGMREGYQRLSPEPANYEQVMNKIIALWRDQPNFTLEELRSIRTPALIAAGEHDVVRTDHTQALAAAIPGARLWIVPGASHSAMQEQPVLVNKTVLEFLATP